MILWHIVSEFVNKTNCTKKLEFNRKIRISATEDDLMIIIDQVNMSGVRKQKWEPTSYQDNVLFLDTFS